MSAITLVEFHPGKDKKELKRFIDLPWAIYKSDKAWVPPLRLTVVDALDTKKNPFYQHAEITCWNAYRNGEHVGRIAAIVDQVHNEFHNEKTGFWGFFECIDDQEVTKKLFAVAEAWVKAKGMTIIRGPANPSLNHECGLLINNFARDPYVMMTHNPAYYEKLVENEGHKKVKDLLAFEMPSTHFGERVARIAELVKKKSKMTFRPIDMKNFQKEVGLIQEIYNDAWEKNWGFTPMNDAEFKHMAKSLKDALWPEFCILAFKDGEPVGFSLSLPDINQVLKDIPNGKLLPFGIFKLLSGLNPKKKKINRVRVITLGVKQKYRASGVPSVFYYETYKRAKEMGLWGGECSWILEDNDQMIAAMNAFSGEPAYKTYRMYDKSL